MSFIPRRSFPGMAQSSWYPGHMHAASREIRQLLNTTDLVLEVRDARIPLSSRNPAFAQMLAGRPRILVYNKADLASPALSHRLLQSFDPGCAVVLQDAKQRSSVGKLLGVIRRQLRQSDAHSVLGSRVLVVGMPNVGKSTLLNSLRAVSLNKGKAARTGGQPGITRSTNSVYKLFDGPSTPNARADSVDADEFESSTGTSGKAGARARQELSSPAYLIDTPGIMIPFVPNPEVFLKLALVGCIKETIVPVQVVADYLLYLLNLSDPGCYGRYYGLSSPRPLLGADSHAATKLGAMGDIDRPRSDTDPDTDTDGAARGKMHEAAGGPSNDILTVLHLIAARSGRLARGGGADLDSAARLFVHDFRRGKFGRLCLDDLYPTALEERVEEEAAFVSKKQARRAAIGGGGGGVGGGGSAEMRMGAGTNAGRSARL